jgi:hypothetical protein
MKFALLFVFLISFGFSSDNYLNDSNLKTDDIESPFANEITEFENLELLNATDDCPCCNCYELYIVCTCTSFYAQWCSNCSLFPPLEVYVDQLCFQACG